MANVCVSVSDEMKKKIEKFETVNWSAVARRAFEIELSKLELMDKLVSKSKVSEKEIELLSRRIKSGMAKWHNEMT